MQKSNQISEKSKRRTFFIFFLTFKKVEIIEKADARARTTFILHSNSIRATFLRGKV